MEKIVFTGEDGQKETLYCLEQTRIGQRTYLLVTDREEGDGDAWIFRDMSEDGALEAIYEPVEDEQELEAVASVFAQMLEDVDLL